MEASRTDVWAAMDAEFRRLGLDLRTAPNLAINSADVEHFLARLRSMQPGVTWHDVLPSLPSKPRAYKPFGPYDYQELPTGPAMHIHWDRARGLALLDEVVRSARDAGWPIYGVGHIPIANPDWPTFDAIVVFQRGTSDHTYYGFEQWLEQDGRAAVAVFIRPPDKRSLA